MATRLKTTAFTRFLLMLIIVGPLAYIGASYYNGQDPIANLKKLFGSGEATVQAEPAANAAKDEKATFWHAELEKCRQENATLNRRIGELEGQLKAAKK